MRLWSLHPRFLDPQGLGALWREGLLAQAVLLGRTKGYKSHPQLERFKVTGDPPSTLAEYLSEVWYEASARGYNYNASLVNSAIPIISIEMTVTQGQINYEWQHLLGKLKERSPKQYQQVKDLSPQPHPMFTVVAGEVESWERVVDGASPGRGGGS